MHLLQSDNTYQELIQHMETCGYSSYHIQRVKREMKWLSQNQDVQGISSYEEACHLRSLETESAEMKKQFCAIYSLFRHYAHLTSRQVPTPDIIPSDAPASMTFSAFHTFQSDTLSLQGGTGLDNTDRPLLKYN